MDSTSCVPKLSHPSVANDKIHNAYDRSPIPPSEDYRKLPNETSDLRLKKTSSISVACLVLSFQACVDRHSVRRPLLVDVGAKRIGRVVRSRVASCCILARCLVETRVTPCSNAFDPVITGMMRRLVLILRLGRR